ncbi:hypothetical protein [Streptomyces nojiriensis]|uniref:hypothetical protein n=1 Tax=Streptomyces nojiriensis TaxID=66374 RepID=UPI00365489EA
MTPQQIDMLIDFAAHDVAGNLVAASIIALVATVWRKAKRPAQPEDPPLAPPE